MKGVDWLGGLFLLAVVLVVTGVLWGWVAAALAALAVLIGCMLVLHSAADEMNRLERHYQVQLRRAADGVRPRTDLVTGEPFYPPITYAAEEDSRG